MPRRPFPAAAAAARRLVDLGYNPLPSRADVKGPAMPDYARYRDGEPIPASWAEDAHWWAANVQVACGCPWRLAVVDVDGPLASIAWRRLVRRRRPPRTWQVRTGGGGLHLYWSLPPWLPSCPSRKVWGLWDAGHARWYKHNWIELLADRALVIAPPSRHVATGEPYRWLVGPDDLPRPAPIPRWVLAMPSIAAPAAAPSARPMRTTPPPRRDGLRRHEFADVLARVPAAAKLELAVAWGLRLARATPGARGGYPCHAIGRDDVHPSATYFPETGVYCEPHVRSVSFFRLAAELGAYASWQDACDELGGLY